MVGGRSRNDRGFTLIELLVVLVIFGIALGLVAVRLLPDDAGLARREGEQMAMLLERATDEAETTGQVLAWHPAGQRDRFEQLDASGHWQPLSHDEDFTDHGLPGALRWTALQFTAGLDNAAAPAGGAAGLGLGQPGSSPGSQGNGSANGADTDPRVVFLPGQPAPEFAIAIADADAVLVTLRGDALGHVRLSNAAAGGSGTR